MMRIDVTQHKGVGVLDIVKQRSKVRRVVRWTGRRWRNVGVNEESFAVVDVNRNPLGFSHAIIEERTVDGGERERVVDEKRHSPPTTRRPRSANKGIACHLRRLRVFPELCFLKSCYPDTMIDKESAKVLDLVEESIAIPLHDYRRKRR